MHFSYYLWILLIFINITRGKCFKHPKTSNKPHIVIILVDDMGFNDVSFHGSSEILTPNIDALAYDGIILNRLYVPHLCTPSRSALLTGKYPMRTGTQHFVIVNGEPWGLPLEEQLMPEFFRSAGYTTHLVGKWHLGFYQEAMTPIFRGFDHHYGYYSGFIDYFNHQHDNKFNATLKSYVGLDFRRDLLPWPEANSSYATDVFTQESLRIINEHNLNESLFLIISHLAVHAGNLNDPMQALEADIKKFSYISDKQRRIYAGMISRLDQSVGQTVAALAKKGILENTIILLYSDNGAPTEGLYSNGGSNYPFKGQKDTPWEGAIRTAGLIWSPLLKQRHYVSHQLIHAVDWLPTFAFAANITLPPHLQLDGINVWPLLSEQATPQPRQLLHVLDNVSGFSSLMQGNYKFVNGTSSNGKYDKWFGVLPSHERHTSSQCYELEILTSKVSRSLKSKTLTKRRIKQMRQEATVRCHGSLKREFNITSYIKCDPLKAPCLFDIERDPCEQYNLANIYSQQVQLMAEQMHEYLRQARSSARIASVDALSNPKRFNGVWQWWYGTE